MLEKKQEFEISEIIEMALSDHVSFSQLNHNMVYQTNRLSS